MFEDIAFSYHVWFGFECLEIKIKKINNKAVKLFLTPLTFENPITTGFSIISFVCRACLN